jgi:hypothetical protein
VFVETAADALEAIDNWAAHALDAAVALEPEAIPVLRDASRPYLALEDAYDPRRIVDLAEPILRDQQIWAACLDRWLQSRIPAFAEHDFQPARLYLYWLKLVFDSLAIRAYPMTWALERWRPSWIWHPGAASSDGEFASDLMFRKSLYPAVLRSVAAKLNIDATLPLPSPAADRANDPMATSHWRQRLGAIAWVRRQRTLLGSALEAVRRRLRPSSGDPMVLGDGYDLRPVLRAAIRSRIEVEPWRKVVDQATIGSTRGGDVSRAMSDAWLPALAEAELLTPARVHGCDLRNVAESRIRFWWDVLIPQQWRAFAAVRQHWGGTRVQAVAVAGLGDHIERGAFAAMRSIGVRTYIYQHGGFVGACECPPWDCNDFALADYELTYGRGTAEYFMSRDVPKGCGYATPVAVGSSRLDSLRGSIRRLHRPGPRPRILLVPNLIPRNNRYFDAGTMPDVLESELQEAVVATAREFPAYDFIYKAFPYHDQRDTPAVALARTAGSNCRVELEASLPRMIARAELIVLLFPSTALLEALLSDKPAIVLVDPRFVKMRPAARAALERRATVAESPQRFLDELRRLLQDGRFAVPTPVDDLFLHEYGTHLGDGKSADRALAAIALAPAADVRGHVVLSPPTVS